MLRGMERSRTADRRRWTAMLRGIAGIFVACYALTLAIHWAHRVDWLRPHTFAIAVPGALILFGLAGIVPTAFFAALRFRLRFSRPLGALWLACAVALTIIAATARI
jgi:hypothetical protein